MADLLTICMQGSAMGSLDMQRKYPIKQRGGIPALKQYVAETKDEHMRSGQNIADYFNEMYAQAMDETDQELNGVAAGPSAEALANAGDHFMNSQMIQGKLARVEEKIAQQKQDIADGKYTQQDVIDQLTAQSGQFNPQLPNENARIQVNNVPEEVQQEFAPVE